MKTKKLGFLFLFGLVFSSIQAQTMYVRPITGTQITYPVANIQKLTFSGENLLVTNTTGAGGTYALSSLRYLNFTDLTLGTSTHELVKNRFYVYPNPVTTILNITSQESTLSITHLEIISLEGRLLLEQNPINTSAPQVEVSTLPQGIYFCKITSNNIIQTIKFLKQ